MTTGTLPERTRARGAGGEPGAWGPTLVGGRRLRRLRIVAVVTALTLAIGSVAVASTGYLLYQEVERNLTRVEVEALVEQPPAAAPLEGGNYLVVGSDRREGLDPDEVEGVPLGSADEIIGARSDTIMLVSVAPAGAGVNVVSFPRDLLVLDDGRISKLNETFNAGPDNLIRAMHDNFGIDINHYVEVSVAGFLGVVETLGSVDICIDEPLVDANSGADFEQPGCYAMTPTEALSYVRYRGGDRGDFQRIDHQQNFMRAMLAELTSAQVLTDLPRLFRLVEEVASNVTTDDELGLGQMRELAEELRGLAGDGIPMTTVPGYTQNVTDEAGETLNYVIAYEPGARAVFEAIRDDEPVASRGTTEDRADTAVALWSGGRPGGADIVARTLDWAGYGVLGSSGGPDDVDAGAVTTVHEIPGFEDEAGWVAASLGAPVEPLPDDVDAPEGADVVVAIGDDAVPSG